MLAKMIFPLVLVAWLASQASGALLFFNDESEWRAKIESTVWPIGITRADGPLTIVTRIATGATYHSDPPWYVATDPDQTIAFDGVGQTITTPDKQSFLIGVYEGGTFVGSLHIRAFGTYVTSDDGDWNVTTSQRNLPNGASGPQVTLPAVTGFMGWVAEVPGDDFVAIRFEPANGTHATSQLFLGSPEGIAFVPEPGNVLMALASAGMMAWRRRRG